MTVQEAFKIYFEIPVSDCKCNEKKGHFRLGSKTDEFGEKIIIPLDDSDVCSKERAWRNYCRLRDEALAELKRLEDLKKEPSQSDIKYLSTIKGKMS